MAESGFHIPPSPAGPPRRAAAGGHLIAARELWKHYNTSTARIDILKGVDLDLDRGETLAVVGASGIGKSTLLHILGTLDMPDRGRLFFEGEDVLRFDPVKLARFRNRSVGFVFQFFNLLPNITAFENIEMPLLLNGRLGGKDRIVSLLDLVGLKGREGAYPRELSGGEQQRVAIARALVHDPDIILADEPTGNMDSQTGMHVMDLLSHVAKRGGRTVLLVTHDHDVAKYGEKILRIRDGVIKG